jgi:hypothetical protein
MTRKHWAVLAAVLVLAGLSLYLNKDLFAGQNIHIYHRSRPPRPGAFNNRRKDDNPAINPIIFGFTHRQKLIALKVVSAAELATNKYAPALWNLVSESNSVPIKDFNYGAPIQGMHPAIKGAQPDPLEPGVKYRLFVETRSLKAEHEFIPEPRAK